MDGVAIEVAGLAVRYRDRRLRHVLALDAVDLEVRAGEIAGLLGPNGSGKTTLLRTLAGPQRRWRGTAKVLGHEPGDRAIRTRVGVQPDAALPFPHLTGRELLGYVGALAGWQATWVKARSAELLERLQLGEASRRLVRTYSTGMARRLGFAAAVLGQPEVLLLDEPTAGLDPTGSLIVAEMLREAAANGCAVLLASHHLQEVEALCDHVHLLHRGRIRVQGTLDSVLGTGDDEVTLRGLDGAGKDHVATAVAAAGGTVVDWQRRRRHLFALFRDLDRERDGA